MNTKSRRSFLADLQYSALAAGGGLLFTSISQSGCSEEPDADAAPEIGADAVRTQWYRDAKFGMFIHWGPYSVAGVEASWPIMTPTWMKNSGKGDISEEEYTALPRKFNPVEYDPAAWAELAKQAGMRYMVITTKHHDGFCMFDAPGTDYDITNTPYGKDLIAPLADACRAADMRLGFYYSPPDMNHPGYRDTTKPLSENWMGEPSRPEWAGYLDYMESHLQKLLTEYGDVALIWFDGLFAHQRYEPDRMHGLIHQLSPATLINDRLGPNGDYITPEQFFPGGIPIKRTSPAPEVTAEMFKMFLQMLETMPPEKLGEQLEGFAKSMYPMAPNPSPEEFQLWETCMTMNETWGYNPADKQYKSADKLIVTLVEVASRGGNLLLNVGPTPLGTIAPEQVERLQRIGEWMKVNGEAIHGTTYGPLQGIPFARTTAKGNTVYLHVLEWPGSKLELDEFPHEVSSVTLLAGNKELPFALSEGRLTIETPAEPPDSPVSVLAIRSSS